MHLNTRVYHDLSWEGRATLLILFMFMVNSGLVLLFFKMENVDVNAEPEKLIGPVLLIVVSLFLNYKLRIHCRKKDNYSWKRAAVNFAYNFFTILGLICLAYWDGKINYYIVAYALLISYFFINSTFEFGKKETVNDFGK